MALSYLDTKAEKRTPLLLIHGFPFDHRMWKPQIEFFSERFRVIAPDLQGFGKSPVTQENIFIDHFAEDLKSLVDDLKCGPVHLCGFSMGGYVAMRFIDIYPDLCFSLSLVNTRAEADDNNSKFKRFQQCKQIQSGKFETFVENHIKAVFTNKTLQANTDSVNQIREIALSQDPKSATRTLLAMAARMDSCESLKKIKVPTFIIAGEEDSIVPLQYSKRIQEHIQGAKVTVIPDAAHMVNLENPGVFNTSLSQFIEGLAGTN